jgi:hypothetical protein
MNKSRYTEEQTICNFEAAAENGSVPSFGDQQWIGHPFQGPELPEALPEQLPMVLAVVRQ